MNRTAQEIIMRRRRRDSRRDYNDYDMRDYRENRRDYNDYEHDYKQGVKGTGRYGIGGSRYYGRRDYNDYEMDGDDYARRRYRNDYSDYRDYDDYRDYRQDYRDYRDYGEDDMRLTKMDMQEWKSMLINPDGTKGEHFDKRQIEDVAEKMGIKYTNYDEADLCMAANALYSDYSEVLKMYIPQDKEAIVYTKLAHAFLDDKDASARGSEKLAVYYNCIVKDE